MKFLRAEVEVQPEIKLVAEEPIETVDLPQAEAEVEQPVMEVVETPVEELVEAEIAEVPVVEEPVEEIVEEEPTPVSNATSWIPEQAEVAEETPTIEPSDWMMRVDKGTQALKMDEAGETGPFAVPADSILADESAAAAAAAIGIPLFARSAGGTESLTQAKEETKAESVDEVVQPEADLSTSPEVAESVELEPTPEHVDEVVPEIVAPEEEAASIESMVTEAIEESLLHEEPEISEQIPEPILEVEEVVEEVEPALAVAEEEVVVPEPEPVLALKKRNYPKLL